MGETISRIYFDMLLCLISCILPRLLLVEGFGVQYPEIFLNDIPDRHYPVDYDYDPADTAPLNMPPSSYDVNQNWPQPMYDSINQELSGNKDGDESGKRSADALKWNLLTKGKILSEAFVELLWEALDYLERRLRYESKPPTHAPLRPKNEPEFPPGQIAEITVEHQKPPSSQKRVPQRGRHPGPSNRKLHPGRYSPQFRSGKPGGESTTSKSSEASTDGAAESDK